MAQQGGSRTTRETQAFVSIITVVYNSEQYLEKTIESIKNQSSKDYELLIIDGGSTDKTLEIVRKNERHIDYWASEPDKGIYDAMNKGIQKATGKYLWFINSGDEINSNNILQQIIDVNIPADIFYGESNLIDMTGKLLGSRSQLSTRKLPEALTWKSLQYGMTVSHQSILVKKSIAPFFNLAYKCSADIDWVVESLKRSQKVYNCNMVLSKYLVGGFSLKNVKKCWKERFHVFRKHYGLFTTLWNHAFIIARFSFYKILSKNNF